MPKATLSGCPSQYRPFIRKDAAFGALVDVTVTEGKVEQLLAGRINYRNVPRGCTR